MIHLLFDYHKMQNFEKCRTGGVVFACSILLITWRNSCISLSVQIVVYIVHRVFGLIEGAVRSLTFTEIDTSVRTFTETEIQKLRKPQMF